VPIAFVAAEREPIDKVVNNPLSRWARNSMLWDDIPVALESTEPPQLKTLQASKHALSAGVLDLFALAAIINFTNRNCDLLHFLMWQPPAKSDSDSAFA
jgi:hypothetical protein